ncbi:hypothetical protein BLS_003554 [Venturia inaequalis]|uniref:Pre-mRNA-splicing factor 38B n=1 Tax=Venturia inaequalis TaxID=5025 RepID=A0A8H3YTV0_VENIN|nr:hypothetical protein BLS_003554 [Venturia inaequalis]
MDRPLDDDYVANLLKEDAKKANQNASLIGMRAYMPQKTNAEAPKPNKRFLRNIIRETNSHNQALLAKEAEESRARLRDLREKEAREARKLANGGRSPRDHSEERHRTKRRRVDIMARDSNRLSPPQEFEPLESRRERSRERAINSKKPRGEDNDSEDEQERSTRRPHKRARETNTLDQAITKSLRRAENHRRHRIGPLPPHPAPVIKVRGRGAISSSAMDSRFSASYDPNADVEPEVGPTDDWEMALEAMRDRAKFKQTQGDRLRAAGFSEDEVNKWEKGGEKTEEDVRWAKKGEGREWDRGKVVDEVTGHVDSAPEWGRLKGT